MEEVKSFIVKLLEKGGVVIEDCYISICSKMIRVPLVNVTNEQWGNIYLFSERYGDKFQFRETEKYIDIVYQYTNDYIFDSSASFPVKPRRFKY